MSISDERVREIASGCAERIAYWRGNSKFVASAAIAEAIRTALSEAEQGGRVEGSAFPELDSRAFYEVMQIYRHAPIDKPADVVAAFEAVKAWLRFVLPSPPAHGADEQDARRYRFLRRFDHFSQVDSMLDTTEYNTLDAAVDAAMLSASTKDAK